MGDQNQRIYLKRFVPTTDGPVIEIGSKDYGSTASFRDHYIGAEYVGLDMSEGAGVDVIVDLTKGIGTLRENHFALGICCSVLEHVEKPWIFAENLTRIIRPGGKLYMSVPWVWRFHAYPDDYFRFSHRGVITLFEQFDWAYTFYSTAVEGEFVEISAEKPGGDNELAMMAKLPNGAQRKYLPYLMVNMIGTKKDATPAG